MSEHSKIEWTEATWNPVRGCVKISPGCKHCYAETFAEHFRGVVDHPYQYGFDPRLVPGKLLEPLAWPSAKMVFVNSMSDLFQESVPDDYIIAVAEVMLQTPWHTYQVLTKRSSRLNRLLNGELIRAAHAPHIWWGVSVEDKKYGLPRIDHLRDTPAAIRFLSIEPLLEDIGRPDLQCIHWAIVGGESGPGARPMDRDWVENIRESCGVANAHFFFKQWGGVQKARHGRTLNGRTYDDMPPASPIQIPPRAVRLELRREMEPLAEAWPATVLVTIEDAVA